MEIKLTDAQSECLDTSQNILVEAGAGSGKTTVFIQRFITLLATQPDVEIEQILGITYTTLAASELLLKLQDTIQHERHPALKHPEFKDKLAQSLHRVPFMTIHGLCSHICRKFPKEAQLDPEFSICDDLQTSVLIQDSIQQTLKELSQSKNSQLKKLLLVYSYTQLSSMLTELIKKRLVIQPIIEKYTAISDVQDLLVGIDDILPSTIQSWSLLKALLETYNATCIVFQQTKQSHGLLDYDDLILTATEILKHPTCLHELQKTFRYIMVDEFQDTDHYQWDIIQQLCDDFNPFHQRKLFLVGDIKQSIYSFRNADPGIFMSVFNLFKEGSHPTKVVHMSDNFRSQESLITTVNLIFQHLFSSSKLEVPYTPLSAAKSKEASLSLALLDDYSTFESEILFMRRWIQHIHTQHKVPLHNIAIITRRKTHFDAIKTGLEAANIPVSIESHSNFFRKSHILDITHVIECIISPFHALPLYTLLLSPIFSFTSERVYLETQRQPKKDLFEVYKAWDLNEKDHDKREKYIQFIETSKTHTITDSLESFYSTFSLESVYAEYQLRDIDVLLHLISQWEKTFDFNRRNLLLHLRHCIDTNMTPPNGSKHNEGVRLLTIHASKGLEFSAVILPELHQPFNMGKQSSLFITKEGIGISHADGNQYRDQLIKSYEDDLIDEEKRLFYVACTRAKDHLLLLGNATPKSDAPSYLQFLRSVPHYTDSFTIYATSHDLKDNPISFEKSQADEQLDAPLSLLPDTEDLQLSVSQIDDFFSCPKKIYLQSLFKVLNPAGKQSLSLEKGTLTHRLLEEITKNPDQDHHVLIRNTLAEYNTPPKEELTEFLDTQITQWKTSSLFTHIRKHIWLSEKGFSFRIGTLTIDGRFDLLFFEEDTAHVIDFKTGDAHSDPYQTQLKTYMLALSSLYPNYAIKASLFFTQSQTIDTLEWNSTEMDQFKTQLHQLPSDIHQKMFKKPPKSTCDLCPLFQHDSQCPERSI